MPHHAPANDNRFTLRPELSLPTNEDLKTCRLIRVAIAAAGNDVRAMAEAANAVATRRAAEVAAMKYGN